MKKIISKSMIIESLALAMVATSLTGCGGSSGVSSSAVTAEQGQKIEAAVKEDPTAISGTINVGGWPSGDDAFEAALSL